MYVKWSKLKSAIKDNDQSYRNYVKTFGFLVIKNFFDSEEYKKWIEEYDKCYLNHFKKPFKEIMNKKAGQAMVPNFVDDSEYFSKVAFDERFIGMAKYFCGEDFLYMGSDGSSFRNSSFKWHRDWFTHTPVLKFNMYLNPSRFFGGNFMIFPGSQTPSDSYPNLLNRALAWPFGETRDGGMNERGFFPHTPSPRQPLFKSIRRRIFGRRFQLPYTRLRVKRGDIVLFDQRAIHVVERTVPRVTRRLLTLLFAENPKSISQKHYLLNPVKEMTRDKLSKEIDSLFWLERELIKIPPYGKYIDQNHPLYPKHLFTSKISSSEEDSPIDLSQYSAYRDKFDDQQMKNILYTNNMLGFNLSHIRDIES